MTNTYLANPAVAGTEPGMVLSSTFRHQWAGFEGAPAGVGGSQTHQAGLEEGTVADNVAQELDLCWRYGGLCSPEVGL